MTKSNIISNNNGSIYEPGMSDSEEPHSEGREDDFFIGSPLGWISEISIRLIMGGILLGSYVGITPFIRHVERKLTLSD